MRKKKLHIQNPKIDMGGIEDIHKWEVVHGMGLWLIKGGHCASWK